MTLRIRTLPVVAVTGAAVLFVATLVRVPHMSTEQFQTEANVGEVTGPVEVGQWFESVRPHLSGVVFQFATYSNRENTEEVIFELRQAPDADPIRTVQVNARNLRDHQRHAFRFPPVREAQGRNFFAVVRSPASRPGNAVTLEYSQRDPYRKPGPSGMVLSRTGKPRTTTDASRALKPQADLAFGVVHNVTAWERLRILAIDGIRAVRQEPQRWRLDARFGLAAALLAAVLVFPLVVSRGALLRPGAGPYIIGLLVLGGLALRLGFARHLPYTNDEGTALYDAWTLLHQRLPGGDGILKAPVFLGILALGLNTLGPDILAGRLVSILASVLTVFPLMSLSRRLGHPFSPLTAAALWLLAASPAIFGVYTHAQPIALLFGMLSLASWAMALQGPVSTRLPAFLYSGLAGASLALALGTRKTAAAFALPLVVLFVLAPLPWRKRWALAAAAVTGFLALFGPLAMVEYRLYGEPGLRHLLGIEHAAIDPETTASAEERRSALIKGVLPIFREGLPLLLFAGIGLGSALETLLRRAAGGQPGATLVARLAWGVPLALAWLGGSFLRQHERSEHFAYALWPFWTTLLATLALLAILPRRADPGEARVTTAGRSTLLLAGLWLGATATLYASWIKFTANYLVEFLPALVLLGAFGASWLREALAPRRLVAAALAVVTVWGAFTSLRSGHVFPHTGTFALASLREAADLLRRQVPRDALVLTGAVAIPVLSGHRVPFDVAHPTHYAYGFIEPAVRNLYMAPAEEMVREVLHNVRWVVKERLTAFSYLREYPEIEQHVEERFETVAEIENLSNPITILRRRD